MNRRWSLVRYDTDYAGRIDRNTQLVVKTEPYGHYERLLALAAALNIRDLDARKSKWERVTFIVE